MIHDRAISNIAPTLAALRRTAFNNPTDLDAQLNLGAELQHLGRLEEARTVFAAADSHSPQDPRVPVWLGMIAVQQRKPAKTIIKFKQALSRDPKDPDVWLSLADLQQATGQLKDAEASFETVTRIRPDNETAWRLLGELDVRRKLCTRGRS